MRNIAIALLLILLSNTAFAASDAACPGEVVDLLARVDACEQALDRGDRAINDQADTIQTLDAQNDRLQKALDYQTEALAKESAWYRDPKTVGPVAFIAGLMVGLLGFKGR